MQGLGFLQKGLHELCRGYKVWRITWKGTRNMQWRLLFRNLAFGQIKDLIRDPWGLLGLIQVDLA